MRQVFLILALVAIVGIMGCSKEAEARGGGDPCESFLGSILNECVETHEKTLDHYEKYDFGVFLDVIKEDLFKIKNTRVDVGVRGDYLFKTKAATAKVGAIIKF